MSTQTDWKIQLQEYVYKWKATPNDSAEYEDFLGNRPFPHFVLSESASTWDELTEWLNELGDGWCLRGQRESSWLLETTLDRTTRVEYRTKTGCGVYTLDRESEQRKLLFPFQQQAHLHLQHAPAKYDLCSWLAIMQHFGAPTRLLDWTKSPYVALYFALEEAPTEPSEAPAGALWALDLEWLQKNCEEALDIGNIFTTPNNYLMKSRKINQLLRKIDMPVIIPVEPWNANERMIAQQGLFLCNLHNNKASFCQSLMRMIITQGIPDQPVIRKLVISNEVRFDFLKNLQKMNIHRASLFPGLDGVGKYLKLSLEIEANSNKTI